VLLDGWRAVAAAQNLDVSRDVMRAHRRERNHVLRIVEPGEERAHGDRVGGARVRVADVGGEEVEKPQARVLAGVGDQPGTSAPLGRAAGRMIGSGGTTASARLDPAGSSLDPIVSSNLIPHVVAPVFLVSVVWREGTR
jgi:hypothetical protein